MRVGDVKRIKSTSESINREFFMGYSLSKAGYVDLEHPDMRWLKLNHFCGSKLSSGLGDYGFKAVVKHGGPCLCSQWRFLPLHGEQWCVPYKGEAYGGLGTVISSSLQKHGIFDQWNTNELRFLQLRSINLTAEMAWFTDWQVHTGVVHFLERYAWTWMATG